MQSCVLKIIAGLKHCAKKYHICFISFCLFSRRNILYSHIAQLVKAGQRTLECKVIQ